MDNGSRVGAGRNEQRRPGALFWLLLALVVLADFFNARSGDLLRAGIVSALGLYP